MNDQKRPLNKIAVCKKLGISPKTFWRRLRERSWDFPQPIKVFGNDNWYDHEIDEWLERFRNEG